MATAAAAAETRAATSRLVCGLHSMNTVMLKATSSMQAPSTDAVVSLLEALGAELGQVSLKLAEDFLISGQDWTKRWLARGSTAAGGLHAATTVCVASFAKCLHAAMAIVKTQQRAADLTPPAADASMHVVGMKHFSITWVFASELCVRFTSCALFAEGPAQPDLRPLQPVLSSLVAWLLQVSRCNEATQQALQVVFKGKQFEHLYNFIDTGIFLLHPLKGRPLTETQQAINHIPPGFISSLCCLVCEVAPWPEQRDVGPHDACLEVCAHKYMCLVRNLGYVLGHFLADPESLPSTVTINPELVCPAAVEVAKRAVFATYTMPDTSPDDNATAQLILMRMLHLQQPTLCTLSGGGLKARPTSLPNTSTILTPCRVTKDYSLVMLLFRCSVEHPQCVENSSHIIFCLAQHWMNNEEMFMDPDGPACVALVLCHCSHHLCRVIKQQRFLEQQDRSQGSLLCADTAPLSETQRLPLEMLLLVTLELFTYRVLIAGPPGTLTPEQDAKISTMWEVGAYQKLLAWLDLPSPGVLLELILRHQVEMPATSSSNVESATLKAVDYLIWQYAHNPSPPVFVSNISCVVSIHKLLLVYALTMHDVYDSSTTSLQQLFSQLNRAHLQLQELLAEICANCKGTGLWRRPVSNSSTESNASTDPSSQSKQMLHQLRAVIVMVLVWVGNLSRRMIETQPEVVVDCTIENLLGWKVKIQANDAELAGVASQLSLPLQPEQWGTTTAAFKRECVVWDEYARRHFHGRLLPGCSYLGCTNLKGTSEVSLPTLLCSGCRRMRYCRVECQQAAWSLWGHSDVCGKGKWACKGGLE